MPEVGIGPSTFSFNAAVGACAKCGQWPSALDHLSWMHRARILRNIISFSAAITSSLTESLKQVGKTLVAAPEAALKHKITAGYVDKAFTSKADVPVMDVDVQEIDAALETKASNNLKRLRRAGGLIKRLSRILKPASSTRPLLHL